MNRINRVLSGSDEYERHLNDQLAYREESPFTIPLDDWRFWLVVAIMVVVVYWIRLMAD